MIYSCPSSHSFSIKPYPPKLLTSTQWSPLGIGSKQFPSTWWPSDFNTNPWNPRFSPSPPWVHWSYAPGNVLRHWNSGWPRSIRNTCSEKAHLWAQYTSTKRLANHFGMGLNLLHFWKIIRGHHCNDNIWCIKCVSIVLHIIPEINPCVLYKYGCFRK